MDIHLPQGLVNISNYQTLLKNRLFADIEIFSNNFLREYQAALIPYRYKWVTDPLHQWSRQWEYPFAFAKIMDYAHAYIGRPLQILDAGSGITFFPYLLKQTLPDSNVTCCDTDTMLEKMFSDINSKSSKKVCFINADIRKTGLIPKSFDVIYCVSVLEHTSKYSDILKEFSSLLKDDGLLIITFDISLDGRSDIEAEKLDEFVAGLEKFLSPVDESSVSALLDQSKLFASDIVTTRFISEWRRSLLPWKYPFISSILASLRKRKFPSFALRNLTFSCNTFRVKK